jgi:hypothetical protein
MEEKASIMKQEWFAILMVVFVAPFGIFLIWKNKMFPTYARILLSIIFGIIFFLFLVFLRGVWILTSADGKSSPAATNRAIVGEWEYDSQKIGTIDITSNFKFEKNGNFKWLVFNSDLGGNTLIEGTYSLTSDAISLTSGTDTPFKLSCSIQGDSMMLDGLYYKKGNNLNYTPTVTNSAPAQVVAPTLSTSVDPVSMDLSAGVYVVGQDVPAGKYDITAISGSGNFFGKPGIVNEVMGVEGNYSIPEYKNATFKNGNEIEIKGNLVVNLTSK